MGIGNGKWGDGGGGFASASEREMQSVSQSVSQSASQSVSQSASADWQSTRSWLKSKSSLPPLEARWKARPHVRNNRIVMMNDRRGPTQAQARLGVRTDMGQQPNCGVAAQNTNRSRTSALGPAIDRFLLSYATWSRRTPETRWR